MAVEFTEAGYQSIRDYIEGLIPDPWEWVEIRDGQGAKVIRISTLDERVSWIHDPGDQLMVLRIELSGMDNDLTLPQDFESVAIKNADSDEADDLAVDTFTSVTFETTDDALVLRPRFQVPEIT